MVNQSIIEAAERFARMIPDNLLLRKAYLFGSYAKGNEREESDIDVAIVLGNMTDFFEIQKLLMRIRRKVDLRIEPHPIDEREFNSSNPFVFEIQKNGIELFSH